MSNNPFIISQHLDSPPLDEDGETEQVPPFSLENMEDKATKVGTIKDSFVVIVCMIVFSIVTGEENTLQKRNKTFAQKEKWFTTRFLYNTSIIRS